jgi:Rad3-related DNA helicase
MLMGYVEFTVPNWIGKALGLQWPIKGARKSTLQAWLRSTGAEAYRWLEDGRAKDVKEKRRMGHFRADCYRVADEIQRDQDTSGDHPDDGTVGQESGKWLRDYDTATFTLKPVVVGPYGARRLWRHGDKFLLMSGSIISADEMAESLGLPHEYAVVTVPMTFPVEHRPIISAPIANIRRNSTDQDYANLCYAVDRISELHRGERVLVHTVSFHLAQRLIDGCKLQGRRVCSYKTARDKQQALDRYMGSTNSIMFAPSMDRGVDLPDDGCRVVVVAKVPFPSLGDRRVSARLRLPGGQSWYAVQTVRKIVQMTGRGVRSEDDYAVSYILDQQFATNVWAKSKALFPGWWRDAVQSNGDVRWLMTAFDGKVDQPTLDQIWQEGS